MKNNILKIKVLSGAAVLILAGFAAAHAADAIATTPTPAHSHHGLPPNCHMPDMSLDSGVLYKNGQVIASNAVSYQTSCSGDVVWVNSYRELYKNDFKLGDGSSSYQIAIVSGDVMWMDGYNTLHKNISELGKADKYQITRYTGDVVWTDGYGTLYKNLEQLGKVESFTVCDKTGDVVWTDYYNTLYKNRNTVTSSFASFELHADGVLAWTDSLGTEHLQ
jgi:hypothetical protein